MIGKRVVVNYKPSQDHVRQETARARIRECPGKVHGRSPVGGILSRKGKLAPARGRNVASGSQGEIKETLIVSLPGVLPSHSSLPLHVWKTH